MSVPLNDVIVLLQNEKKHLGLYSKTNKRIKEMVSIRNTDIPKNCAVSLWHEGGNIFIDRPINIPVNTIPGDLINIWQDGDSIIIGVGDMRDTPIKTYVIPMAGILRDELVIVHSGQTEINVFVKVDIATIFREQYSIPSGSKKLCL